MSMKHRAKRKKVPSYWWDFNGEDEVIVQSDDDRFPVVARFEYDPINGGRKALGDEKIFCRENGFASRVGQAEDAVKLAESLIDDLNAGRRNPGDGGERWT